MLSGQYLQLLPHLFDTPIICRTPIAASTRLRDGCGLLLPHPTRRLSRPVRNGQRLRFHCESTRKEGGVNSPLSRSMCRTRLTRPVFILSRERIIRGFPPHFRFWPPPPSPFQKGSGLMSQPKLSPGNRTHPGRGRASSRSANPQAAAFDCSRKRPDENRGTGRQGSLGSPISFCVTIPGRRVLFTAPTGSTTILCTDHIEIAPLRTPFIQSASG
ncbi:hypothetical protein CSHISOI_01701 [Colletotrichum shisoi]|uniref:Uncharacterized protein n=1 Tax=Colletotrichum shisoi TaxID=2078593 RepID=A0A5Q4C4F2_9PEZI|nr:hypothetical protein CSHISOI_01701 [Colletotrichum shisoi]